MSSRAFLALGSNLGDRKRNLTEAVREISHLGKTGLLAVSNIYETDPVGYLEQDRFLNMAVMIETCLEPVELLCKLQEIENLLKRVRGIHWGPRTIDIDILLYDDLKVNLPYLQIPHPRMLQRAFVMVPLRDIYGPGKLEGCGIDEWIGRCADKNGVKMWQLWE